jgi:hypothetical protein
MFKQLHASGNRVPIVFGIAADLCGKSIKHIFTWNNVQRRIEIPHQIIKIAYYQLMPLRTKFPPYLADPAYICGMNISAHNIHSKCTSISINHQLIIKIKLNNNDKYNPCSPPP